MYFAYFLGQDLLDKMEARSSGAGNDGDYFPNLMARTTAQNTFLLALDGDVVFEPDAIAKLVDLMKRDAAIGATCGRIHPQGSGLVAMYQKFEYAVGHWLQKATEDVLGNVLCAPGCFSLYRLTALIESRGSSGLGPAFKAFASPSTSPLDWIQHDQGEDRWLCTLLIERGWRVEYCAISDSYTACPETFGEFYTQRRRWTPSTVANLVELMRMWRSLLRHGNLSIFHLIYQILMLAGATIGPGSIFILLVGGTQLTFDISYWASFFFNLVPVVLFMLVALLMPSRAQILVAKVLSLVYGMCMLAVFFAVLLSSWGSCAWTPSTVSLELTAGAFVLVGLLHPLELHYLLYGVVYYLTIPCMYMLLPLYCVFNLDDVSWGTRETTAHEVSAASETPSSLISRLRHIFNPHREIEELTQRLSADIRDLKEAIVSKRGGQEDLKTVDDVPDGDGEPRKDWTAQVEEGLTTELDEQKAEFWKTVIGKYLQPLYHSEEEKQRLRNDLVNLRNEIALLFVFLNAGWALGILLLQMSSVESSAFTLDWVLCEVRRPLNETMGGGGGVEAVSNYLPLDPINFVFIVFFLVILLIQGKAYYVDWA
jgi:chitin synthase